MPKYGRLEILMKKRLFAILISLIICLTFTLTACDKISVQSVDKDPTNQVIVSSADTVKSAAKTLSPFYALSQASKKEGLLLISMIRKPVIYFQVIYILIDRILQLPLI